MRVLSVQWLVFGFLLWGCHPEPELSESCLTNSEKGKYWDLVYSTDIYGRPNRSYGPRSLQPYDCDYFAADGHVVHYANADSATVEDRGANTDVQFNPDQFQLRGSTLTFGGRTHKVLALLPQLLALEFGPEGKKALRVYTPSQHQVKRLKKVN